MPKLQNHSNLRFSILIVGTIFFLVGAFQTTARSSDVGSATKLEGFSGAWEGNFSGPQTSGGPLEAVFHAGADNKVFAAFDLHTKQGRRLYSIKMRPQIDGMLYQKGRRTEHNARLLQDGTMLINYTSGKYTGRYELTKVKTKVVRVKSDRNIRNGKVKKTYWLDTNQSEGVIELDFELTEPPEKIPSEVTLMFQVSRAKKAGSKHGMAVYFEHDELGRVEKLKKGRLVKIHLEPQKIKWKRNITLTLKALGIDAAGILPKSSGKGAMLLIKD